MRFNDPGHCDPNVELFLVQDGQVVPGSHRRGHNVRTFAGSLWLSKLVSWGTVRDVEEEPGDDDIWYENRRVRWLEVGSGVQLELPHIQALATPLLIDGTNYLREVSDSPIYPSSSRPVRTAVKFSVTFTMAELPGNPVISELGLVADFVDTAGGSPGIAPTTQYPDLISYKVVDPPLQKLTGTHGLVVNWEFKF